MVVFVICGLILLFVLGGAFCVFFDQAILTRRGTIYRVKTDKKRVLLTFDDGPSPDWTPKILDELKQLELLKEKIISSKTEFLEDKLNYIENEINNLNKKCVYFEKNLVLEILNFFS